MAAELSVIWARKPVSSASISRGHCVKVLSFEAKISAKLGNRSSPMSIRIMALNCGMAASDFSPLRA